VEASIGYFLGDWCVAERSKSFCSGKVYVFWGGGETKKQKRICKKTMGSLTDGFRGVFLSV